MSGLSTRSEPQPSRLRGTLMGPGHRRKRVFSEKAEPTIRRLGGGTSWADGSKTKSEDWEHPPMKQEFIPLSPQSCRTTWGPVSFTRTP